MEPAAKVEEEPRDGHDGKEDEVLHAHESLCGGICRIVEKLLVKRGPEFVLHQNVARKQRNVPVHEGQKAVDSTRECTE